MVEDTRAEGMLSPYRILDLTDEKGLMCGRVLGDLGADVIQIEKPEGDSSRKIGPSIMLARHIARCIGNECSDNIISQQTTALLQLCFCHRDESVAETVLAPPALSSYTQFAT